MTLDAAARRRHARQLLLGEVAEAGQERLLASRFRAGASSDPRAFEVAADYARRAGCGFDERGDELVVPGTQAVHRFAGADALREAAAAVIGAFCAVEHVKAVVGAGTPAGFPEDLRLSSED